MRYTGLDPSAQYTLRVVYAAEPRRPSRIRLTANGTTEVHPYLTRPYEILEFAVPKDATKRGELRLSWNQEPGGGGAGRGCQVAEAWLIKKER
jgi:hypothetical protein